MIKSWQQPLPSIYRELSDAELRLRIESAKERLGKRLLILGHHYQQDAIIDFADFTGDSFELSRKAADQKGIEYVVFCGVHFMAESADILTDESVRVILPDLGAGCSMADMANLDQTIECWEQLQQTCPDQLIVPITYMNSSAAIKAFVGEHGGAVCTSSNCSNVLEWALKGGAAQHTAASTGSATSVALAQKKVKILFFPDQHLGRNTAHAMGYPLDKMVVWDPRQDLGGNNERDLAGSTAYIVQQVEKAPPGTEWAIGTEVHLINRLAKQHPEQKIIVLSDCQCLCTTMYRIDLPHLCWALENLVEGKVVNEIKVDATTRKWATVALERMLAIKGTGNPIGKQQPIGTTVD
jgi:quinolinate synthase